ncbi:MAG: histidine--tRNA ligase [bacterium]
MITKQKGTYDILPEEARNWVKLEAILRNICKIYNYEEIRTPVFEASELFHRTVGESSDIVSKETYTFKDRSDRSITLRPEGTAGVVRAYIENKLYKDGNLQKLFYINNSFRYERPQKGRQRQFHQFGIEALNSDSPFLDAEIILLGVTVIRSLGLKGVKVRINSIGDLESRAKYKEELVKYFNNFKSDLCGDCLSRLEKNPLRILDCKVDNKKEYFNNVPKITDYLNEESKSHFNKVLAALDNAKVEYEINPFLVRGLDYYSHTVFEIEAAIEGFGSQNVLAGGGRYDGLVESLDGPKTSSVGMAFGMERLLLALESEGKKLVKEKSNHLYVIALGDEAILAATNIVNNSRMKGLITEMDYQSKSMKAQFKQSDKYNSKYIAILGETELKENKINVKNVETQEQVTINIDELVEYIINDINGKSNCGSCGGCK